ncbi:MAG: hypothetical protein GEU77_07960 [Deltaproteobacteria bacterium]|nr:hypothetical protein [Deltaproteobacteria bacterium]
MTLVNVYLSELLQVQEPPCLSLYQPTHRHYPENQKDPIRFRNLVKGLEQSLGQKYPSREIQSLLQPFQSLTEDGEFWNRALDGLAVLSAAGIYRVYRLQRPVPELFVVADSFHVKPLLRIFQSADRYQVLALNRQEVKLLEGNRDALDAIELAPNVPQTITQALGEELTEPHQTVASYGMGAGGPAMRHGHGSKKDEIDIDTERFFRAVDRAVLEHHSRPSGLPLILAALPEHHSLFRQVSHNPFLMEKGIEINPDALPNDALRERAWNLVEPNYLERLAALVEEFGAARSKALGAEELDQVVAAAIAGRVSTLLIESERQVAGRINAAGGIELDTLDHPEVDDLLDDVAELVLRKGGQIVVVPKERMPTQTGLAAIFRF